MDNYKMTIAYDGRKYKSFNTSRGSEDKTVQGKLEAILYKLCDKAIEVVGAVSTEAGVHAKGQVVSFKLPAGFMVAKDLRDYIEKYLTDDIIVLSLEGVDDRFHSKYQMKSATYQYRLWKKDAPTRPLFERNYVNYMVQLLDVGRMQKAAESFVGEHDFMAFTTNRKTKKSIKTIYSIDVVEDANEIVITMVANGYLLNMARKIVGTLVQVGLKQLPLVSIENAFEVKDMDGVGHKSSASGLCLLSVNYK